jgi:hypothetical protein
MRFSELEYWDFIKIKVKEGKERKVYYGIFIGLNDKHLTIIDISNIVHEKEKIFSKNDEDHHDICYSHFCKEKIISVDLGEAKLLLASTKKSLEDVVHSLLEVRLNKVIK